MKITQDDLKQAVTDGIVTEIQATQLWESLASKYESKHLSQTEDLTQITKSKSNFNGANVAYYFGALLVISSMTWFMTAAWGEFGGWGICFIAIVYAVIFVLLGRNLWFKQNLEVPGGLLYTLAVCMAPLGIFGFELATGIWVQGAQDDFTNYFNYVKGSWILIEVGTIIAALVALKYVRFPFLIAPIAFTLWYMSMDLTPLLFGKDSYSWEERLWVSLIFGLGMLIVAYLVDRRTKRDFAFWLYLFGSFSFWFGLRVLIDDWQFWNDPDTRPILGELVYLSINLLFMVIAILLQRRVLMVFASIGVFSYISILATEVFAGSALFPFVLSGIGLAIIFFGVFYQKNHKRIETRLLEVLPAGIKQLLPANRFNR